MFHPRGALAILLLIEKFPTIVVHLSTKISIGTEMVFSLNLDKMSKIDILNGIQIRISLKTFF